MTPPTQKKPGKNTTEIREEGTMPDLGHNWEIDTLYYYSRSLKNHECKSVTSPPVAIKIFASQYLIIFIKSRFLKKIHLVPSAFSCNSQWKQLAYINGKFINRKSSLDVLRWIHLYQNTGMCNVLSSTI